MPPLTARAEDAAGNIEKLAHERGKNEKCTVPTEEELEDAKKAFEKIGGVFGSTKNASIRFGVMPKGTGDEDLKKIPNLSLLFGLSLTDTKVTDAGMKEIAKLKHAMQFSLRHAPPRYFSEFSGNF